MNRAITSREDLLLAKIAGKDVDISTMTPPVAASVHEDLMLEIAEKFGEVSESASKMAGNVAHAAGEAPTAAEFDALIDALIEAGIMAGEPDDGQDKGGPED